MPLYNARMFLDVSQLSVQYTGLNRAAVDRVSLGLHAGEMGVLIGPSGCGKTTTLRMIAGLELPTAGEILLGGDPVTFKRASERDIAFVFQLFALYPHMNVRANIGFPLKCDGVARDADRRFKRRAAIWVFDVPIFDV